MKVVDVKEFSSWDELYNIHFKFKKEKKNTYIDTIITLDTETSNGWYQPDGTVIGFDHDKYNNDEEFRDKIDNGQPVSLLYLWMVGVESNGEPVAFGGRNLESLNDFLMMLTNELKRQSVYGFKCIDRDLETKNALKLSDPLTAQGYIVNTSFEYQILCNLYANKFASKRSKYGNVFARTKRKPMKFTIPINGVRFTFRDTVIYEGVGLAKMCEIEHSPVKKLSEPEDFYLPIRIPCDDSQDFSDLTDEEIQYAINDVVSMIYCIDNWRKEFGCLKDIPLTATSLVRKTAREMVSLTNPIWAMQCTDIMQAMTPDELKEMIWLFQGGWVHGNKRLINKVINAKCLDLASAYPAVLCTRKMPVSSFRDVKVSLWDKISNIDPETSDIRWYAKITVKNVISKRENTYWSLSKVCTDNKRPLISGQIVDNGRIFACNEMTILLTDLDYATFRQYYTFSDITVHKLRVADADYMPKEFILMILKYYGDKTLLKQDENDPDFDPIKEVNYRRSKTIINGVYGSIVMKLISLHIFYDKTGWQAVEPTDQEIVEELNKIKPEQEFAHYACGVWTTAWERYILHSFILHKTSDGTYMDKRVAYCDTDSLKGDFTDEDMQYVEDFNKHIEEIENNVADMYGFDRDLFAPKTPKGKQKRLGIMEREPDCQLKVLGAKRYCACYDGKFKCTVAGLPKKAGSAKIKSFDDFSDDTTWNTKESKKLIANYNDNQPKGQIWTDSRTGKQYISDHKYGICLQPTTFNLGLGEEFRKFLEVLMHGGFDKSDNFFIDTPEILR